MSTGLKPRRDALRGLVRLPVGAGVGRLFMGLSWLLAANGLFLVVLSDRATDEGFSASMLSLVLAAYYAGFLLGSKLAPRLLASFGGPLSFSVIGMVCALVMFAPPVIVAPWWWTLLRIAQGMCFASLYVVGESWINNSVPNDERNKLLGLYLIVVMIASSVGAALFQFTGAEGSAPFRFAAGMALVGGLCTVGLPATAGGRAEGADEPLGFFDLVRRAPVGVWAGLFTAIANGAFISSVAVYGERVGFSETRIAWFSAASAAGPLALQWPITRWSDNARRSRVIVVVTLTATLVSLGGLVGPARGPLPFVGIFVLGGLTYTQYSLYVPETNDHIEPGRRRRAGAHLVLITGFGAIVGTVLVGRAFVLLGDDALYWVVGFAHLAVAIVVTAAHRFAAPSSGSGGSSGIRRGGQAAPAA
jgi:MFS family permease